MTEVVARAPKPSFQAAAKRDVARYIVAPVTIALAIGAKLALSPIASDESVSSIARPAPTSIVTAPMTTRAGMMKK